MDKADLQRLVKKTGFSLMTLEKDYTLTLLLSGIYSNQSLLKDSLVFKGGTALRKIYFQEWRLSEDLDFTQINTNELVDEFKKICEKLNNDNLEFYLKNYNTNPQRFFGEIKFRGPLKTTNTIKIQISRIEWMLQEPERKSIVNDYNDIPNSQVLVYSQYEILLEKIRSMFQRTKARDYYDVWRLLQTNNLDLEQLRNDLISKCSNNKIEFEPEKIFDADRLNEIRDYWSRSLANLTKNLPEFKQIIDDLSQLRYL